MSRVEKRERFLSVLLPVVLALGCGDDPEKTSGETVEPLPTPVVITADWLAGSLSFASLSGLLGSESHADAVVTKLDLSEYAPGPLALELTPDKKKVLVAVSSGFFALGGAGGLLVNAPDIPAGPGKLLVVDIDKLEVEQAIDTGEQPMGIAVTPDGKRAFVAHFGSGNMAVVDLETYQIVANIDVGIYAEEVVFDETGTVGVVGYSDDGSVKTFSVADPEHTLTNVKLEGDSAGIAFFPGTKTAFVVEAPNPLSIIAGAPSSGYTLLDVSDPSAPKVLQNVREAAIIGAYPAMAAPNRGTVIVPSAKDNVFGVREYALENNAVKLVQDIPAGSAMFLGALGFAYDGASKSVIMGVPGQRAVIVTNLDTKQSRTLGWEQDSAGPADVVIR